MHRPIFNILLLLIGASTFAQDSLLTEKLKLHTHTFNFENGQLTGEGFEFFKKEASESPFFLIGEDHGIAEIPLFTAALFRAFKPLGFRYFATETGPYTADLLQQMAAQSDWKTRFEKHFETYPWSIPFYGLWEECEILQAVVGGQKTDDLLLWGLDQEFAASPRMLLKKLHKEAKTEASKAVAKEYYEMAERTFKESFESKNPAKAFMAVVQPNDFAKLKLSFEGQPLALDLIREMEESIHIYQLWFTGGGYESNCLRAEMMKRHFTNYYDVAKSDGQVPKIMFKFGANHIYRGSNGLNVFDIGNFVSELASREGTHSFHLYAVGRKGTKNAYTPFSQSDADKAAEYDATRYLDRIDFSSALEAVPENEWAVVDLRPIREMLFNKKLKGLQKGMEKLVWSYDAMLIIPEVHASTFIND